jgi:shikimate kinase
MRYYIIGFKNSGKTTFGRNLAERLGLNFIDLDEYIETTTGRIIPQIYTRLGEENFRKLEWKALQEVVRIENVVISTGGGTPCHCDMMSLMEKHGDVIYLKVSDQTLINRLKIAAKDRPIVKGKNEDELIQFVSGLRKSCEHNYLRAKYVVDGDNLKIEEFVKKLSENF